MIQRPEICNEDRLTLDIKPGRLKRFFRKLVWFFTVYIGPPRVVEILTRNGILRFWSKDKTTGRILHVYRNHEFEEVTTVYAELQRRGKLPQQKDSVLDIGGYLGMSSTAFLLESFFQRAYAFEPSPRNFALLQENTALNKLEKRLFAFNIALSDGSGYLEFELSEKNNGDNRVRGANTSDKDAFQEAARNLIKVPALTLDSFLTSHPEIQQDSIGLIWMDIQGHEPRFFAGAQDFFRNYPGVPIYMEFWPYGMKRSGADLNHFFELCETYFTEFISGLSESKPRPVQELRTLYKTLEQQSIQRKNPGIGANVLLF